MNNSMSELVCSVTDELVKQLATTPYGQVGVNITSHGGAVKRVEYTRKVSVLVGSAHNASGDDAESNIIIIPNHSHLAKKLEADEQLRKRSERKK